MTAQQARIKTDEVRSINGEFLRKETDDILSKIASSASRGADWIQTSRTDSVIIARLKHLGYNVKETNDQRDGNFLTVSW